MLIKQSDYIKLAYAACHVLYQRGMYKQANTWKGVGLSSGIGAGVGGLGGLLFTALRRDEKKRTLLNYLKNIGIGAGGGALLGGVGKLWLNANIGLDKPKNSTSSSTPSPSDTPSSTKSSSTSKPFKPSDIPDSPVLEVPEDTSLFDRLAKTEEKSFDTVYKGRDNIPVDAKYYAGKDYDPKQELLPDTIKKYKEMVQRAEHLDYEKVDVDRRDPWSLHPTFNMPDLPDLPEPSTDPVRVLSPFLPESAFSGGLDKKRYDFPTMAEYLWYPCVYKPNKGGSDAVNAFTKDRARRLFLLERMPQIADVSDDYMDKFDNYLFRKPDHLRAQQFSLSLPRDRAEREGAGMPAFLPLYYHPRDRAEREGAGMIFGPEYSTLAPKSREATFRFIKKIRNYALDNDDRSLADLINYDVANDVSYSAFKKALVNTNN